jgi:uncharacterized protein
MRAILLVVCLATGPLFGQARDVFTAGSASAARGTTAYGAIEVPAGSDAAATIPVAVVNGAKSGPVVAFIAGSHGTEYASSIALTKLIARIDPKSLSGTAIIAPLLNAASFEQMTVHTNPIDKKGMNAQYPGDANGTQSQRALALVAGQIVKRAGTIVDLHGGDLDEDLGQYSYWMRSGKAEQDSASRALVLAFGLDLIIVNDVDIANPAQTRSLSGYSLSLGKNVVVAEAGHTGTVEPRDVDALIDGCLNVLASLHMIDRTVAPLAHPVWVSSGTRVRADAPAIWTPAVHGSAYVAEGGLLGTLNDYLGRPIKEVRSPVAGIVTFVRGVPSVWKDATLANVSPVIAEPK